MNSYILQCNESDTFMDEKHKLKIYVNYKIDYTKFSIM